MLGPVLMLGTDEHTTTDEDSAAANLIITHFAGSSANFTKEHTRAIVRMMSVVGYAGPISKIALTLQKTALKPVYLYRYM